MCALRHLIFNRPWGEERKESEAWAARKGKMLSIVASMTGRHSCTKCGGNTQFSYLNYLPEDQVLKYIEYLVDNNLKLDIQCCECVTKFVNHNFLNANDIKGLTLHGRYWKNYCPKRRVKKLILPRPPSERILEALDNMYYLPEGAETFPSSFLADGSLDLEDCTEVRVVAPVEDPRTLIRYHVFLDDQGLQRFEEIQEDEPIIMRVRT